MHGHYNTADHIKKIRAIWSVNKKEIMSKLCLFETERSLLRAGGKPVDRLSSQSPLNTKPVSLVVRRPEKLSTELLLAKWSFRSAFQCFNSDG